MSAQDETRRLQPVRSESVTARLGVLSLAMLLSSLATSSANVALPALMADFHSSFAGVQWVVLAYLLAITALIVSAGRLGDLMGRKRLFLFGTGIFSLASLGCAVAPTLGVLIAVRVAQGTGAAVLMALTMAMATSAVAKEQTGRSVGLLGTMSAVGTALGPTLGGILIEEHGWRAIFAINLPLGALVLALAAVTLSSDLPRLKTAPVVFDVKGTLLLALALTSLALSLTGGAGSTIAMKIVLAGMAIASVFAFIFTEARADSPLIPLPLFQSPGLSGGLAASVLATSVVMATLVVGPFYLAAGLGLNSSQTGLVMSCGPLVAALAGMPSGWLVDRVGGAKTKKAGLLAMLTGSIAMALIAPEYGVAGYVGTLAVITAGYALFQTANNSSMMGTADASQRGLLSGLIHLSRNIGLIVGTSVMGAVFAYASGQLAANGTAATDGLEAVFLASALVVALALLVQPADLTLTPLQKRPKPNMQ